MGLLKSFIKLVRAAKTLADERAVIRKELAKIRTKFRDILVDQDQRHAAIAKLVYLYILGEKTHFGQVECLKLIALPRFGDKRLGYMAVMLLLDENVEVLTLLTNQLDNDMLHRSPAVAAMALCTLGNVALPELARDLYPNVDSLLSSSNLYLRKKAAIVAAKLVQKEPELAEHFVERIPSLLNDKMHGPILGALRLLRVVYSVGELGDGESATAEMRRSLCQLTPVLILQLKRLQLLSYLPEYEVLSVTDPFLHCLLLETLRMLNAPGEADPQYAVELNDILTQVALVVPVGKNSGHAVLYECVKTIFHTQLDLALKVLGINILGKFLLTKDNNTRYVALDMLLTVIQLEPQAVQRHRNTIVSCLGDGDVLIRRRALELTFAIINDQNIRVLAHEVVAFLENLDTELKPYVTLQLSVAAAKYAPTPKWHFETLVRVARVAGNYFDDDLVADFIALVVQNQDRQLTAHVVAQLFKYLRDDLSQFGLNLVAVWCVGEFGEVLVGQRLEYEDRERAVEVVTEEMVVQFLVLVVNGLLYAVAQQAQLKRYVLTTCLKLSVRFQLGDALERLRRIVSGATSDIDLEIQTRAVEYLEIFLQPLPLRKGLLEHMPPPPVRKREALSLNHRLEPKQLASGSRAPQASQADMLLDLMDDGPGSAAPAPKRSDNDLLLDIFGGGAATTPAAPAAAAATSSAKDDILGLFGNGLATAAPAAVPVAAPVAVPSANQLVAFANGAISVLFAVGSMGGGLASVETVVANKSPATISGLGVLLAVPKLQKLLLGGLSSTTLAPGASAVQTMGVTGKAGAKVKLRVKVSYEVNGARAEEQFDYSGFPQTL